MSALQSRRRALFGLLAAGAGAGGAVLRFRAMRRERERREEVTLVLFSDDGVRLGLAQVARVARSDAEWRRLLTPTAFEVTRRRGTERAFSGEYDDWHQRGLYRCVCCGNALFSSATKFDSGTGWPSFWAPIAAENVTLSDDWSAVRLRIAVGCTRCDAHLGHRFEFGPEPTGKRWCMNSVALRFVHGECPRDPAAAGCAGVGAA